MQSLLAAVAGLSGSGAVVRIGPRWSEPLVLWQALVGPPSSGKSPAMAPVRDLLAKLEAEPVGDDKPRACVVAETSLSALADAVTANPRGVVLWRDEAPQWLPRPGDAARACWLQAWSARPISFGTRRIERFAVSLLLASQPDRLSEVLAADEELASRFLVAWPPLPDHCPLGACKPTRDDEALAALRRIARKAGTPDDPLALIVDAHGLKAFDAFLSGLQAELREVDGLEMAWLGKGRGTVARLAGVLELLAWSALGPSGPPGHIGQEQVERAVRLWSDYFRPHARVLFHRTLPSDSERKARRVARWLRDRGLNEVSREQVRREALNSSVNASDAEQVLYRLQAAGIVERIHYASPARGGRPPNRWWINPALTATPPGGNLGNLGNPSGG